ncbi:MBL fold metallo-hydrolase [Domibacillus sp. DTU_2020_1001157_1_SI_ALB_TIR_016]|uniref:MBL fold metallo-hydrolase n=1 Tax=Domibacillus sp. DTU_2020_1001157_1_SI_ALB_TIR_016 TaxID=3077789 RepID=UPI0028E613A4|nr:MBL fold metallo-hydrolase [Domibacillus sp. DTU_2020_1001157_1_SI_ALB_TIR_016]WNS79311.1 MBL fold metallo-hydrolase [Domibacillus sp. DTU_2020_1001157_1_SI_ALB_TIR_016]
MMAVSLGFDLSLIDLHDSGFEERTSCYVFHEPKKAIIETSASPSIPFLLEGLKELHIQPEEIDYVIVTHIHLDHTGGAGLFLQSCPNAKLVVHPKGARHLADPSRLIASAKMVYGEAFDELFDPIVPVPKERIIQMEDGGELDLGGRILRFLHTPGHANHHFSIWDEKSAGMFTGDTAGIQYAQLKNKETELFMPTTSPNQFDPHLMKQSIDKMMAFHPQRFFFSHYGMNDQPKQAANMVLDWLDVYMQILKKSSTVEEIETVLMQKVREQLERDGVENDHPVYELLAIDLNVSAQGMIHYKEKQHSK